MRILLLICFAASVFGQNPKLPPDIDPQSNSRLPSIQRDQLSDEDKKVFDDVSNTAPGRVSLYNPRLPSLSVRSTRACARPCSVRRCWKFARLSRRASSMKVSNGQAMQRAPGTRACLNKRFPMPKTACADDALA